MLIRLAIETDLPAINRIYNQAVVERFCTAHLEPRSLEQQKEWFREHDPGLYPVFVSEVKGKVTGWASLGFYRKGREALAHVAEVSYYVDAQQRGKGTGSALLEHAISVAPSFGFSVLIAILLSENPASIALLRKYGFSEWGSMPSVARIEGHLADHLYYGLHLIQNR
jgi:L-amino acid N-acyltransferase YncA